MLTLTPIASEAIRQLSAQTDDPEVSGIRIAPGPETPDGTVMGLASGAKQLAFRTAWDDMGHTAWIQVNGVDVIVSSVRTQRR